MNPANEDKSNRARCVLIALLFLGVVAGCKHQPTARERQMMAFQSGQQRVINQMMDARRTNIRVIGNVRYPEIGWRDELTLAQVIAETEILDRKNPTKIFIYRQSGQIPVEPEYLLRGGDVPLEPGDTVQIQP